MAAPTNNATLNMPLANGGPSTQGAVILCRAASTTMFRRQKRPDHFPFFVCNADPLAQGCLQKPALNQRPSPQSSFVHET